MRPVRTALLAVATAGALLVPLAGVAEAQETFIVNSSAVCNPTTGEYDITASFANNTSAIDFEDVAVSYDNGDTTGSFDLPDFTLPGDGDFDVTYSVPGDSIGAELDWFAVQLDDFDSDSIELDGDCVAVVTTTTTTARATTTTAATGAVAVTPTYTG